jgi:hypothetical protein
LVLGSQPEAQTEPVIDEYGYDTRFKGYALSERVQPDQMARARAIIEAACTPMSDAEIAQELTKVRLATVSNTHGPDLEGWMQIMIEELRDFPAAVVVQACKQWRRREKFLPGCAELREECHQHNRCRRALRRLVGADGERGESPQSPDL